MMLHGHASAQIRAVEGRIVQLLQGFLLVLDYKDSFIFKHFVCELQTLNTLQLRVNGFAFHSWVVAENTLIHVFLGQLKAVLVGNLA